MKLPDSSDNIFRFDAIGTQWEIASVEPLSATLQQEVLERIALFDKTYSRFRNDSLISQVANAFEGGRFEFPDDSIAILDLYDKLYKITNGAVDPLVGGRLEQLGYDKDYSFKIKPDPHEADPNMQEPLSWGTDVIRDGKTITTKRSVVIDIGAAGKGYLVDIICGILLRSNLYEFVVDASGDIRHCGIAEISVGLEHPSKPEHVIGVADIRNLALCASATNRRVWGNDFHHILDARSGLPANRIIASWAIAENAMTADGLATALFFNPASTFKKYFNFSSIRMFADHTVEVSENFPGEIFY
jgi:thiamine biosynthesis lipoprotein